MANAGSITVWPAVANNMSTVPAQDILDTGTVPVTLTAAVGGLTDRVLLRVVNLGTAVATVSVKAGTAYPAFRRGVGDLAGTVASGTTTCIFGPFESARFIKGDGTIDVQFAPTGTINLQIQCIQLPPA